MKLRKGDSMEIKVIPSWQFQTITLIPSIDISWYDSVLLIGFVFIAWRIDLNFIRKDNKDRNNENNIRW
jgi:prolipoprotein diacylglyceryltransferase